MKDLSLKQQHAALSLIDVFRRQSEGKRAEEMKQKPNMKNEPKSRLTEWPALWIDESASSQDAELIHVWTEKNTQRVHVLRTSTTTYFEARDEWNAMDSVLRYLQGEGFTAQEAFEALPQVFNFVYGVLVYLRLRRTNEPDCVLLGVRATNHAGRNAGTVSFPGGLVDAGEKLDVTAPRELIEEGGERKFKMREGFTFGPHNAAPSITFMCMADTTSRDIAPNLEWAGKRMVWVPETFLERALNDPNDTEDLADAFRQQGFDLPGDTLAIAPDAIGPAKMLLKVYPE